MINDLAGGVIGHAGIATTFGLIVMVMVYAFGEVSGAHINPAVTIAFWLSGRFPAKEIAPYVIAQIVGAVLASATLLLLFPTHENLGATLPVGSVLQSFVLEVILTFFLMLVIMNVSSGSKELGVMAGMAIGAMVLLEAMFAGPISGASMNPARSIGPALMSDQTQHLWVYITAPVIGAALSILVFRGVKGKESCPFPGKSL